MADPGFVRLSTPPSTVLYRLLSVFCAGLGLSLTNVVTEPALVVMIMTAKCPSEIIIRALWGKKKFIIPRPGNCIAYWGHIIRLDWGWCRGLGFYFHWGWQWGPRVSWAHTSKNLFLKICILLCCVLFVAHGTFSCSMQTLSCNMWDLVPWPGVEPTPPAVGVNSSSHRTTVEVPSGLILYL